MKSRTINLNVRVFDISAHKTVSLDLTKTAKEVLTDILRTQKDLPLAKLEKYKIFLPHTGREDCLFSSEGHWLAEEQTLEGLGLTDGDFITVKRSPSLINVVVVSYLPIDFTQFNKNRYELLVDFSDNISEMIPRLTKKVWKDFTSGDANNEKHGYTWRTLYFNGETISEGPFLNANVSLKRQAIQPNDFIALYPLKFMLTLSVDKIPKPVKDGYLQKQSIKNAQHTPEKKRWFVLKDNFLWYFIGPKANNPKGCIDLEYYSLKRTNQEGKFTFELHPTALNFGSKVTIFILSTRSNKGRFEWMDAISRKTVDLSKRVFGVRLKDILTKTDRGKFVPTILEKCSELLLNNVDTEGLFRVPGATKLIQQYQESFNTGQANDILSCNDPHTIAGVLKLWLRELQEPLLFDLYNNFVKTTPPEKVDLATILPALRSLPIHNQHTLGFILDFLYQVAQHSDKNKMTAENLAMVFGPNLLRSNEDTSENIMANTTTASTIVELLIKNAPHITPALKTSQSPLDKTRRPQRLKMLARTMTEPTPNRDIRVSQVSDKKEGSLASSPVKRDLSYKGLSAVSKKQASHLRSKSNITSISSSHVSSHGSVTGGNMAFGSPPSTSFLNSGSSLFSSGGFGGRSSDSNSQLSFREKHKSMGLSQMQNEENKPRERTISGPNKLSEKPDGSSSPSDSNALSDNLVIQKLQLKIAHLEAELLKERSERINAQDQLKSLGSQLMKIANDLTSVE